MLYSFHYLSVVMTMNACIRKESAAPKAPAQSKDGVRSKRVAPLESFNEECRERGTGAIGVRIRRGG